MFLRNTQGRSSDLNSCLRGSGQGPFTGTFEFAAPGLFLPGEALQVRVDHHRDEGFERKV